MQQFFEKLNIGFADLYVTGFILCIGAAEVAHFAGLFLGMNLSVASIIWGGIFTVLLLGWIGLWCRFRGKGEMVQPCHKALPLMFVVIVLVQMLYLFCMQQVSTPGDIMLETVETFLHEDGIHKVNPLTGSAYVNPLSMRYKILCLPTLYGGICKLTGASPELVVYHIVPLLVLGGCYFAYYKLSGILFQGHTGKRYTFMILVALLLFCMDGAVYLDGYGIMQAGYMGTSIRNLILIPWTVTHGVKKQWWYCVLCVLAEFCICQTLYGLGFCVLITMAMITLHLCEEKILPKWRKDHSKEAIS